MPAEQTQRDLSVIIPSYNARGLLCRAVGALIAAAPEAEVIVVDGASTDGSADAVRERFPSVKVLEYPNYGWGHSNNRGVAAARGDYILLMNSDLFITQEAIETMQDRLAWDTRLGGVGATLLNEDGSRQRVFGVTYWPNWSRMTSPRRVKILSGACLMTRRHVLERAGGFDENLFLYNEEYDWCERVRNAGYDLELLPARVTHVGGASTPKSPNFILEEQRGYLYVTRKHHSWAKEQVVRSAMQSYSMAFHLLDPRSAHREMWGRLAEVARHGEGTESPFVLSGRGQVFPGSLRAAPSNVVRKPAPAPAVATEPPLEAVGQ